MKTLRIAALATMAALALVATACAPNTATTQEVKSASGAATVAVTLSDFTIAPSTMQVPADREVRFDVSNQGPSPHTFAVVIAGATKTTGQIQAGSSAVLTIPSFPAGTYQALCTIPGHAQLGMKATVVAGGASSPATAMSSMAGMSGMSGMTAQQMAAMHKAGVEAFLAGHQTTVQGDRVLQPKMDHGVAVYQLTAEKVEWETSKGHYVAGMAYNGQIPGPQLHVHYGEKIRIVLVNQLDQPTVVHFHGMTVPNSQDGVPYITQLPIMPGGYGTYQFTVRNPPGLYIYHSHFNSTEQVSSGLFGAIVVEPEGGHWPYRAEDVNMRTGAVSFGAPPKVNDQYTMLLDDGPLGFTINGKSFPATAPLVANKGDWVLIHLSNEGSLLHPMHLHGYHFEVVGQDGYPLASPYMADTLVVAPGQTFDILVHAIYPGAWAFHCHVLPHVEGPQGMYGMVTALVVK